MLSSIFPSIYSFQSCRQSFLYYLTEDCIIFDSRLCRIRIMKYSFLSLYITLCIVYIMNGISRPMYLAKFIQLDNRNSMLQLHCLIFSPLVSYQWYMVTLFIQKIDICMKGQFVSHRMKFISRFLLISDLFNF